MTKCNANLSPKTSEQMEFSFMKSVKVTADFAGGDTTSDAGWLWIRQEDERQGLCQAIAEAMHDPRDARYSRHSLLELGRQRVYQMAAGYEDCNDADELRVDSALKAAAADRRPEDKALASQPTLSRFENRTDEWELERIMEVFVRQYVKRRRQPPTYIIVDIDPTDDVCHGEQQLALFHGYFGEKIYHDLLIFDGETGELILPILRPGSVHGGDGVDLALSWLFNRLRAIWPETEIVARADGGLASPRIYEFLARIIHKSLGQV